MARAVDVVNLYKEFPTPFRRKKIEAVKDVSLYIDEGEIYGLIGPNGSGKSTAMKALLGLLAPTKGTCQIFGKDSIKVDSRKDVGYVPENPYFYKHLNGEETLKFYGKLCGLSGVKLKNRITELLEQVSLTHARKQKVGTYSKGMLQRIGLAQALIHEPRLLILDEPTAGVDPVGSREIRDMILGLKEAGKTVFLCSHLLEQVQEICDRVGIIFNGVLKQEGTLDELITLKEQFEVVVKGDQKSQDQLLEAAKNMEGLELINSGSPKTSLESLFIKMAKEEDDRNS